MLILFSESGSENLEEPESPVKDAPQAGKAVKKVRSRWCKNRDAGEKCFCNKCRSSRNVALPTIDYFETCIFCEHGISVNAFSREWDSEVTETSFFCRT